MTLWTILESERKKIRRHIRARAETRKEAAGMQSDAERVAYRAIFDEWRKTNSVVDMAAKGEINLYIVCNQITDKLCAYGRNWRPNIVSEDNRNFYITDNGKKIDIAELEDVWGEFVQGNFANVSLNPVTLGVGVAALGYGTDKALRTLEKDREPEMSRRTLMTVAAATAGVLVGSVFSVGQPNRIKNSYYIQSQIESCYNLKSYF